MTNNVQHKAMDYMIRGITNKPKRDATAIFNALCLDRKSKSRTDLLASRLVRYHWDIQHMAYVKLEYVRQYQVTMQQAVAEGTRGDWGRFCEVLCEDALDLSVKPSVEPSDT